MVVEVWSIELGLSIIYNINVLASTATSCFNLTANTKHQTFNCFYLSTTSFCMAREILALLSTVMVHEKESKVYDRYLNISDQSKSSFKFNRQIKSSVIFRLIYWSLILLYMWKIHSTSTAENLLDLLDSTFRH